MHRLMALLRMALGQPDAKPPARSEIERRLAEQRREIREIAARDAVHDEMAAADVAMRGRYTGPERRVPR